MYGSPYVPPHIIHTHSVPSKEVTCYPNNKPWLTKALKQKLIAKRQYIYRKDRLQLKLLQKDLDKEIQQCKQNYKRKLEANFSEGNSRQAWKGLLAITGYKTKPRSFSNTSSADAKELCDNLNTFYARFDSKDDYSTATLSVVAIVYEESDRIPDRSQHLWKYI